MYSVLLQLTRKTRLVEPSGDPVEANNAARRRQLARSMGDTMLLGRADLYGAEDAPRRVVMRSLLIQLRWRVQLYCPSDDPLDINRIGRRRFAIVSREGDLLERAEVNEGRAVPYWRRVTARHGRRGATSLQLLEHMTAPLETAERARQGLALVGRLARPILLLQRLGLPHDIAVTIVRLAEFVTEAE